MNSLANRILNPSPTPPTTSPASSQSSPKQLLSGIRWWSGFKGLRHLIAKYNDGLRISPLCGRGGICHDGRRDSFKNHRNWKRYRATQYRERPETYMAEVIIPMDVPSKLKDTDQHSGIQVKATIT